MNTPSLEKRTLLYWALSCEWRGKPSGRRQETTMSTAIRKVGQIQAVSRPDFCLKQRAGELRKALIANARPKKTGSAKILQLEIAQA